MHTQQLQQVIIISACWGMTRLLFMAPKHSTVSSIDPKAFCDPWSGNAVSLVWSSDDVIFQCHSKLTCPDQKTQLCPIQKCMYPCSKLTWAIPKFYFVHAIRFAWHVLKIRFAKHEHMVKWSHCVTLSQLASPISPLCFGILRLWHSSCRICSVSIGGCVCGWTISLDAKKKR